MSNITLSNKGIYSKQNKDFNNNITTYIIKASKNISYYNANYF